MRIHGQSLSTRVLDLIVSLLAHGAISLACSKTTRADLRLIIKKEVQLPILKWAYTASKEAIQDAITEIEAEERKES